jgi:acyl-CoA hydrolase
VNNSHKASDAGKVVSCFAYGSPELYAFMNDNPSILMLDASYTNDTAVIRRHPKMTAINSCIEIDLTGQIVSDSIGTAIFSGIGGQMDFIRGASLCPDGRAIIAMPSRTGKGISRITPFIKQGAGVVTTRAHAHYVATEYGIVDMFGKTLQERARQLISVAHPDDRAGLEKSAFERGLLGPKAVAGATL